MLIVSGFTHPNLGGNGVLVVFFFVDCSIGLVVSLYHVKSTLTVSITQGYYLVYLMKAKISR